MSALIIIDNYVACGVILHTKATDSLHASSNGRTGNYNDANAIALLQCEQDEIA